VANTVGFLGAGQLGAPMVERLLAAGHDVLVYARREDAGRALEAKGAALADSVADLAHGSDVRTTRRRARSCSTRPSAVPQTTSLQER
jgi:3-hydroxyisobutyrate dehydrogenase-like beta-hydroxyacid dehydrogenase